MRGRAWVVILNWNGKDYIRDCLRHALAQTYQDYTVAVVDNASTDGSREVVRDEFSETTLIALPQNLHFARGTNAGVETALRDPSCEFVICLNNDTRVDPEWLAALVRAADQSRIGSVAAKLLLMDHPNVLNSTGFWITRDGAAVDRGWLQRDEGQFDREVDVFGPSAGAALYRREALETVGLFDPDFVAYLEDVDLAWRIRLAGFEGRFAPNAIVYHQRAEPHMEPCPKLPMAASCSCAALERRQEPRSPSPPGDARALPNHLRRVLVVPRCGAGAPPRTRSGLRGSRAGDHEAKAPGEVPAGDDRRRRALAPPLWNRHHGHSRALMRTAAAGKGKPA